MLFTYPGQPLVNTNMNEGEAYMSSGSFPLALHLRVDSCSACPCKFFQGHPFISALLTLDCFAGAWSAVGISFYAISRKEVREQCSTLRVPIIRRLRQEDHKYKSGLSHGVKSWLRK